MDLITGLNSIRLWSQFLIVQDSTRPILWVGESQPIIRLKNVDAVLHTAVVEQINGRGVVGAHINSHLIDGGKTNWHIRVEVVSKTTQVEIPNFVYMTFVESPRA